MFVRLRSLLLPSLLPLALAACVDSSPAIANAPTAPPLGVDLGGAPARRSDAVELASASQAAMTGMDHSAHGGARRSTPMAHEGHGAGQPASPGTMLGTDHSGHASNRGEIQMAHEGHGGAHGTGTVTAVNAAQRKVGLQHEPIPAIGWPAMTMELAVAPAVNLQGLQPGSRINFSLEKGPDGIYMIQWIQPAGAGR
jgi:Cu/Ag efflux protein CusF